MPKLNSTTAKKTLLIFLREMLRDKKKFLGYIILIPLNRILYIVVIPLIFSFVVQALITDPHNWQHPMLLLGLATLTAVAALLTSRFGLPLLWNQEELMRTNLTGKVIKHLLRQSDQFFANQHVGSLAGNMNNFAAAIVITLDAVFLTAISIAVNFTFSLVVIAFLAPALLVPLTLVTGFLVWHSFHALKRRSSMRFERKDRQSRLTGTVADILSNQQIVRFFGMRQKEAARVIAEREAIERIGNREIDIIGQEVLIRHSTLFAFQIIVMALSVYLFTTGQVTVAALVFTVTYLGRLTNSLFDITPVIRTIEQALLDSADITEILEKDGEVVDKTRAHKLRVTKGEIDFDHVQFAYQDSTADAVISDLTLAVKPGERIGLAGHSGGGKTTLTKLLLRFADLQSGTITIDGQDISQVTQNSLHHAIAYVPQEAYLFHRTLRENIAYGRPDATEAEVITAARQANALDFIQELPNGFDTIVGERGVKLSGGQRQRIAIARAILKDAPILVLDEATSALDSESEKLIQDALAKLMKNRTSIVIAHRLSTIAKLDRIVVLDKGTIVEDGTHSELLAAGGIYARLWTHQSGGFLEE